MVYELMYIGAQIYVYIVIVASAVQREMKSVAVCNRVCDNSAMKWCNCDMILLLNAHCYMYKSKREKSER